MKLREKKAVLVGKKWKTGRQAVGGAPIVVPSIVPAAPEDRTVVHPVGAVGISIFILVFFIIFGLLTATTGTAGGKCGKRK